MSGRFYVYNLNWDVYPTEDEEAELLKELHEYGYNELIQLLDMDEFQDIVHEQRNKKLIQQLKIIGQLCKLQQWIK